MLTKRSDQPVFLTESCCAPSCVVIVSLTSENTSLRNAANRPRVENSSSISRGKRAHDIRLPCIFDRFAWSHANGTQNDETAIYALPPHLDQLGLHVPKNCLRSFPPDEVLGSATIWAPGPVPKPEPAVVLLKLPTDHIRFDRSEKNIKPKTFHFLLLFNSNIFYKSFSAVLYISGLQQRNRVCLYSSDNYTSSSRRYVLGSRLNAYPKTAALFVWGVEKVKKWMATPLHWR